MFCTLDSILGFGKIKFWWIGKLWGFQKISGMSECDFFSRKSSREENHNDDPSGRRVIACFESSENSESSRHLKRLYRDSQSWTSNLGLHICHPRRAVPHSVSQTWQGELFLTLFLSDMTGRKDVCRNIKNNPRIKIIKEKANQKECSHTMSFKETRIKKRPVNGISEVTQVTESISWRRRTFSRRTQSFWLQMRDLTCLSISFLLDCVVRMSSSLKHD